MALNGRSPVLFTGLHHTLLLSLNDKFPAALRMQDGSRRNGEKYKNNKGWVLVIRSKVGGLLMRMHFGVLAVKRRAWVLVVKRSVEVLAVRGGGN